MAMIQELREVSLLLCSAFLASSLLCIASVVSAGEGVSFVEDSLPSDRRADDGLHVLVADVVKSCETVG